MNWVCVVGSTLLIADAEEALAVVDPGGLRGQHLGAECFAGRVRVSIKSGTKQLFA